MGDPDPDPDPLSSFLVPPPTSPNLPRSAQINPSRSSHATDLQQASPKLHPHGHIVRGEAPSAEIEIEGRPDGDPSAEGEDGELGLMQGTERPPVASTSTSPPEADQEVPVPPAPSPLQPLPGVVQAEHSTQQPSARSTEATQEKSASQDLVLPASPTSIDTDLQESARALLPELKKELERINKQRAAAQRSNEKSTTSLQLDSPRISQAHKSTDSSGMQAVSDTMDETALLQARIPANLKGKQIQRSVIHGDEQALNNSVLEATEKRTSDSKTTPSKTQEEHQLQSQDSEEGWESYRTSRKHRGETSLAREFKQRHLPSSKLSGFEFFKSKLQGQCYNCFSPNHLARDCTSTYRCWKCSLKGHRAASCNTTRRQPAYKEKDAPSHSTTPKPPPTKQHFHSYADAVRGQAAMANPRYPGDPRARPERAYCAITATGDIRRRRDDLVSRAAVCWLRSNSQDTQPHHLDEALRSRLHLRHEDLQVVKHFPELFLIIFREPADRDRLLARGSIYDGGRDFNFAPWNERLHAVNVSWEFRVKVRVEGIPPHCWAEDVAARVLGRSCAVHYVEEKTRRRERTRTFDLWAWCSDPCDIPMEVILTVTLPDREPPPTSIPFLQAPRHRDDPVDIKRGHTYTIRNHIEWVEDLTFMQGRGRQGGFMNRKASREFIWTYGAPDSVGERPPGRGNEDRGRQMDRFHRRDDEDGNDREQDRRSHGMRRQRSLSSWARNARCRGAMDDCASSNRWRGGRNRTVASTLQVWRVKDNNNKTKTKTKKRVTFADPIATVLKPPKSAIRDDSIFLIKGDTNKVAPAPMATVVNNTTNMEPHKELQVAVAAAELDTTNNADAKANKTALEEENVQSALAATIKLIGIKMAQEQATMHFQRPVELSKMAAIQVLVEQENKKKWAAKKKLARVALEA